MTEAFDGYVVDPTNDEWDPQAMGDHFMAQEIQTLTSHIIARPPGRTVSSFHPKEIAVFKESAWLWVHTRYQRYIHAHGHDPEQITIQVRVTTPGSQPLDFPEFQRLLGCAHDLLSEDGENPEYDRALVELVCDYSGIGTDRRDEVLGTIRGYGADDAQ